MWAIKFLENKRIGVPLSLYCPCFVTYTSYYSMAVKASPALLKLQEQLTCGKCHNLYTNPRMLPYCFHSFCQQCIEVKEVQKVSYSVHCFSCNAKAVELSSLDEVETIFPVAPKLNELREVYNSMKQSDQIKCGNCSNADATNYCKECNKALCKECIDMHKRWSEFAKHVILGLEEALKAPTNEAPINKEVAPHVKTILSAISGREAEIKEQGEAVKEEIRSFVRRSIENKLIREVDEIVDRKLKMLEKQKKESLDTSHEVSEVHPIEKADIQFIKSSNESISHHVGSVVSSVGLEEYKVKEITTIKHIPEEKAISFQLSIESPAKNRKSLLVLPASSFSLDIVPATESEENVNARVISTDKPGVYQVICTPVIRGHHQVNVSALGVQLKGSSFVIPFNPYEVTPIRTIYDLGSPRGVAVHDDGRIVVSECASHIVSILSKEGKKLESFGNGANNITFSSNHGVAITDDGYILVADRGNHKIQKISMDGQYVTSVGSNGTETLQFKNPTGIAISPVKKRIYVADSDNHRIQVLNHDLTFCRKFDKRGTGDGEFKGPCDIAIDSDGLVYVTDYSNHCIQKFTRDGKYLSKFGTEGTGPGQLKIPAGITVDNAGLVYVSEYYNHRVSVFTSDGAFIRSFGEEGPNEDQFKNPYVGMTFDKDGLLYICDNGNHRLVVY